jgi:hypothetical protein
MITGCPLPNLTHLVAQVHAARSPESSPAGRHTHKRGSASLFPTTHASHISVNNLFHRSPWDVVVVASGPIPESIGSLVRLRGILYFPGLDLSNNALKGA